MDQNEIYQRLPRSYNSSLLAGQVSAFKGPPAGYYVMREFFVYQVPVFASLAAATGTGSNNLLIQADSDFEWTHGVYQFDIAATQTTWATRFIPNMTIQITDSGSGRFISSAAVPVTSIFGDPDSPRLLPVTKVFSANSNIVFTAVNFDAATATGNLRLSLLGWKLYYYPHGGSPTQQPMA